MHVKLVLEESANAAISWFNQNSMKVNPSKFQGIIFKPNQRNDDISEFRLSDGTLITPSNNVKLLGMSLDNKLTFSIHIKNLLCKCTRQLNVISRLSKYLSSECKMKIFNAFTMSNMNYCSTIYHFCSISDAKKLERIQKRFLRYVLDDFSSSYDDLLLASGKDTLHAARIRTIVEYVYKIKNNLLPPMEPSFFVSHGNSYALRHHNTLVQPRYNYKKFGYQSLRYQGAKLWNEIPNVLRTIENPAEFKSAVIDAIVKRDCNSCIACTLHI